MKKRTISKRVSKNKRSLNKRSLKRPLKRTNKKSKKQVGGSIPLGLVSLLGLVALLFFLNKAINNL